MSKDERRESVGSTWSSFISHWHNTQTRVSQSAHNSSWWTKWTIWPKECRFPPLTFAILAPSVNTSVLRWAFAHERRRSIYKGHVSSRPNASLRKTSASLSSMCSAKHEDSDSTFALLARIINPSPSLFHFPEQV